MKSPKKTPHSRQTSHVRTCLFKARKLTSVSVLLFLLIFIVFQSSFQASRDTWIERIAIDDLTVRPAAWLIGQFAAPMPVLAQGHRIVSPAVRLSVLNGCEGFEGIFLILSAVLAFNAAWKYKIVGMLVGIFLMYSLNQIRILSLFFALRFSREAFQFLHGTLAPTLIIVFGCLFFFIYLTWTQQARGKDVIH